jgi:hypothetical protein
MFCTLTILYTERSSLGVALYSSLQRAHSLEQSLIANRLRN